MNESPKKTPDLLTRKDIEQMAAEADERISRLAKSLCSVLLMAVAALGVVFIAALWLGLVVIASVLIAVCLVTVTLYLFVRLWPTPPPGTRPEPAALPIGEPETVPVLDVPGAPKSRILWTLREMGKRQEGFKISGRSAERFARTIRFILKAENRRWLASQSGQTVQMMNTNRGGITDPRQLDNPS